MGGGKMGADIARVFAAGRWPVHVVEPSERTRASLGGLATHASLDGVPWADVAIVVECIPEVLEAKREAFARLEKLAPREAVLASNSSAFPISAIARGLETQDRMAGLHFFLPAHLVPLVEVIRSERMRPDLPQALAELMRSLGKVPVQVRKDIPGFLANRLQHALAREAYALIDSGVATPQDIDLAVRFGFGFRYLAAGPCLQRDHAGLDIHAAAAATMYPTLANNTTVSPTLTGKVARGELGLRTGQGFYEWDPDSAAHEKARYDACLRAALEILEKDSRR